MGGGYYDRDDSEEYVPVSNQNFVPEEHIQKLDPSLDPKRWCAGDIRLVSQQKNPIVFALDVTGSMGEWTKVMTNIHNIITLSLLLKNLDYIR